VEDLAVLRWGYKHTRELARRMESYHGEFEHPDFPKNSEPATSESAQPLAASAPKIHYTPDDDKVIDDFRRLNGELAFVVSSSICLL
jgi:alcohol oxidase